MPTLTRLLELLTLSPTFWKGKAQRVATRLGHLSEVPSGSVSEECVGTALDATTTAPQEPHPESHKEVPDTMEPLARALVRRPRRCVSEPILTRHFCESGRATPAPKESHPGAVISTSFPDKTRLGAPIEQPDPEEAILGVPLAIQMSGRLSLGELAQSATKLTQTVKRRQLLALPAELRMQIYDELLAIPRTVYMLEEDRFEKSHVHQVMRFDPALFSKRALLRFKHSTPSAGLYDPRTTTFAARFHDDDGGNNGGNVNGNGNGNGYVNGNVNGNGACTYRIWSSQQPGPAHGVPTSAQQVVSPINVADPRGHGPHLIFPVCSAAAQRQHLAVWNRIYEQHLSHGGPEMHILELQFPRVCSLISVMKGLLLQRLPGWPELRRLSVVRIRLRSGNGGPLNEWDSVVLETVANYWTIEMERKVLLRRGPIIETAW